jgi:hypothetical protein
MELSCVLFQAKFRPFAQAGLIQGQPQQGAGIEQDHRLSSGHSFSSAASVGS